LIKIEGVAQNKKFMKFLDAFKLKVQVCDATVDAMKIKSQAHKNFLFKICSWRKIQIANAFYTSGIRINI
jgi:hypothetical protein